MNKIQIKYSPSQLNGRIWSTGRGGEEGTYVCGAGPGQVGGAAPPSADDTHAPTLVNSDTHANFRDVKKGKNDLWEAACVYSN